jgi:hypothetical protein
LLSSTQSSTIGEEARVHGGLTVEITDQTNMDREAAVPRLKKEIASMCVFLEEPLPSREELHDRR